MGVELSLLLSVGENGAEHPARLRLAKEMVLVGSLVVGVARRDHHAFNSRRHHLVEVRANAVGIGAVKERRVGGNPEACGNCGTNPTHRDVVAAFAADGEVMMLTLSVDVHRE